jgi:hypothetical protein
MNHPSPRTDRTPSRLRLGLQLGTIGLIGVLSLVSGCSKPPPPPPPPAPTPPPPPPPNIKLEDVSQELHADARVQVAPGLEVGPSETDLAKAVVQLANAIAKGDSKAVRPMLTRSAQTILDTLDSEGGWTAGTSKIEAVRIVAVQPGVNFTVSMAEPAPGAAPDMSAMITQMLSALPEDQKKQIQAALGQLGSDPAAMQTQLDAAMAKMKEMGVPEQVAQQLEQAKSQMAAAATAAASAASAPPADSVTGTGILLAIQDPMGAYLLGWQADQSGGGWLFTNAPANSAVRPRASAWDGIGQAGFGEGGVAAADDKPTSSEPSGNSPSGSEPSAPADQPSAPSEPSGPRKKNTPAGPVTIPGG